MFNWAVKIAVLLATVGVIFANWLASTGAIGGITPDTISFRYPTLITPAGYAFAIWGLIYLGTIAFSFIQLFQRDPDVFATVRLPYILTCLGNIGWIFIWHYQFLTLSVFAILALLGFLALLNFRMSRQAGVFTRAVFGLYFGWVTAASIVNFRIAMVANGFQLSQINDVWFACGLLALAGLIGFLVYLKLRDAAYPLAIAWALVAISVKQAEVAAVVWMALAAAFFLVITAIISIAQRMRGA
jgi:hypothetical protein